MSLTIKKVTNSSEKKKFINCQWNFYKNDPNWVPPLKMDRAKLLNEDKNPFFKHSKIQHFLAFKGKEIVGRISAIINDNHNKIHNDYVGFLGFFECINDQNVANSLFDQASIWLKENGMKQIRGPVNPSTNDEVGLLIDAYDMPPVVLMTYNPEYYKSLIENYGFQKEKDLLAYHLEYKDYMSDKLKRMQNLIKERYDVNVRQVRFKGEDFKKDVDILRGIYNSAWQPNWGFVKMTDEEFDFLANDLKQVAEPKLTLIIEAKGKPVGFALALPDINQSLIHNKSGGLLSGIWHLLTKKKQIDLVRIIVLGILPEYQRTGIDSVLYWEIGNRAEELNMGKGEASWILEDNEMMIKGLTTTMHGKHYKTYRVFQKEL